MPFSKASIESEKHRPASLLVSSVGGMEVVMSFEGVSFMPAIFALPAGLGLKPGRDESPDCGVGEVRDELGMPIVEEVLDGLLLFVFLLGSFLFKAMGSRSKYLSLTELILT